MKSVKDSSKKEQLSKASKKLSTSGGNERGKKQFRDRCKRIAAECTKARSRPDDGICE